MYQSEKAQERVRLLDQRLARLRAEKDRLVARVARAERRRDTRRKIVLGGTVLAALAEGGVPALQSADDLRRWLAGRLSRPQDRAVFALEEPAR